MYLRNTLYIITVCMRVETFFNAKSQTFIIIFYITTFRMWFQFKVMLSSFLQEIFLLPCCGPRFLRDPSLSVFALFGISLLTFRGIRNKMSTFRNFLYGNKNVEGPKEKGKKKRREKTLFLLVAYSLFCSLFYELMDNKF